MKVLIIEDEAPAARRLENLIRRCDDSISVLDILVSVRAGRQWFANHACPDLVFSDIQLSDALSFDIFNQIAVEVPIIFTTAYDEYAIKAFKLHSIDYLLKPIKQTDLQQSIHKFRNMQVRYAQPNFEQLFQSIQQKEYRSRFLVYAGENLISVQSQEIAYFYSEDGESTLVTKQGEKYFLNDSLDQLEQELDPKGFFRANRQFIVSIQAIQQIKQYFKQKLLLLVRPAIDKKIFISKNKAPSFKQWLNA